MRHVTLLGASAIGLLLSLARAQPTERLSTSNLDELVKLMPTGSLPAPEGLQLMYVALGIGTQNYTCETGDETATPGTTGATATLYDIGTYLSNDALANCTAACISRLALSLSSQSMDFEHTLQSLSPGTYIGHHYFVDTSPVFALDQLPQSPYPRAIVEKAGEADAPTSTCSGNDDRPVKWLLLRDLKGQSQGGIDTVYRIETAGGSKPATCQGQDRAFNVRYAAQYWIYGTVSPVDKARRA